LVFWGESVASCWGRFCFLGTIGCGSSCLFWAGRVGRKKVLISFCFFRGGWAWRWIDFGKEDAVGSWRSDRSRGVTCISGIGFGFWLLLFVRTFFLATCLGGTGDFGLVGAGAGPLDWGGIEGRGSAAASL
jgi:hypothetical protein